MDATHSAGEYKIMGRAVLMPSRAGRPAVLYAHGTDGGSQFEDAEQSTERSASEPALSQRRAGSSAML